MAIKSNTGKGNFSRQSQYSLEVKITQNSINPKSNSSSVSYEIGIRKRSGSGYWSQYRTTWSATIFGRSLSGTFPKDSQGYYYDFRKYSYLRLSNGTITVPHSSNGSMSGSASAAVHANYGGGIGSANAATSMVLRSIDRATPTISASLVSRGETSAVIRFSSNYPISDFQYQVSGGSWVKIGALSGSKNVTIRSLTPNKNYNVRGWGQRSYNNVKGYGSYAYFSTEPVAPNTPSLSSTNITTNSITLRASASAGSNSPVKNYRFHSSHNNSWTGWSSSSSKTFTGLSPNTSYTFIVEASSGKTSPRRAISVRTDTLAPYGGSIRVSAVGTSTVGIQVSGVVAQAGIKEYKVHANGSLKTTSKNSSISITGLSSGTSYDIRVDVVDNKNRSTSIYGKTKTLNVPISSSNIKIGNIKTFQKEAEISVTATAPAGVRSYRLEISGVGVYSPQTSGNFSVSGLEPFTQYSFTVTVTDNESNTAQAKGTFKTGPKDPLIKQFYFVSATPFEAVFYSSYQTDVTPGLAEIKVADKKVNSVNDGNTTVKNLEPNTEYMATLTVSNPDGQEGTATQSISFRTKEDKWAHISVNGGNFEKINIYIIYPSGETKKIEKSMMGIIGGK